MELHRKTEMIEKEKIKKEENNEENGPCFLDRLKDTKPVVMLPRLRVCRQIAMYSESETIQKSYTTKMRVPTKLESVSEDEETNHVCPRFTLTKVKEI